MQDVTTVYIGGPLAVTQEFPGLDQYMSSGNNPTLDGYYAQRGLPKRTAGYCYRRDCFRGAGG